MFRRDGWIAGLVGPLHMQLASTALLATLSALLVAGVPTSAAAPSSGLPVNTSPPAIAGIARDGSALAVTQGSWTGMRPMKLAYQWMRCNASGESCTTIPSATKHAYKATPEDVGHALEAVVTASNSEGSASATSAYTVPIAILAPAKKKLPSISGPAEDGQLLTAASGAWKGTPPLSFAYQWQDCLKTKCSIVAGATGSSYRPPTSDIGQQIHVIVTVRNSAGTATARSAPTKMVTAGPPVNTALPTISGIPIDGQSLSASTGAWVGTPTFAYSYQWLSCNIFNECADIPGATSSTYAAGPLDVANSLEVIVTATNAVGSSSVTSAATSLVGALIPSNTTLPSITGSLIDGQLLSAVTGAWTGTGPISYSYEWQLCNTSGEACKDLSEALESTLKLNPADVGSTLRVIVTASNAAGSTSATSPSTSLVGALIPSNTSLPTIGGLLKVGQILSATTGGWSGTPPITYGYQWQLCGVLGGSCGNIANATSSGLTLSLGDVGLTLRVVVTATNAAGPTSANSAVTGLIAGLL